MTALPDLGTARDAQQECFGDAFLIAVAGVAGCAVSPRRPDNDSIDWTLSCRLSRRPKLDVQMKTTINENGDRDAIHYPLKRKNYDDLIMVDLLSPRILVLVTLPRDIEEWFSLSRDQLLLRRCAYWLSLAGSPTSDNQYTVTVTVPRVNLFTPSALCSMMQRINEGLLP
jgi:hypothetical protein